MVNNKASIFRVISFTLAGADVLQTMPRTFQLYKQQWKSRTISPVCFFYAVARYGSIISLVSNGFGFYGTTYTLETCRPWYMLPNITAMLAGMAVQILIFIRTYAISGRSTWVKWGLGAFLLLGFPVQVFGIVFHRAPTVTGGQCKGVVLHPGDPDWNIVYYSAHLAYDLVACVVGTFFLVYTSRLHGMFLMTKFIRRVLRNGLLYAFVVFAANLLVVLDFAKVLKTGVGATLPLAVILIAAQHLILSTQRRHSDDPSSTDDYARSHSSSGPRSRGGGPPSSAFPPMVGGGRQDLEMHRGVFVVTETFHDTEDIDQKSPLDKDRQNYRRDSKPAVNFGVGM
ncbi:hypothetical protein C8F01DRAFT_1372416 [Mycena amicta]|nr:hypothetical protein C8F01DRAFT_1372416 [Mycena amicta]